MEKSKKRFFKPWVKGKYWSEGINGKRILVIGASQYCQKKDCPYWNQCTSMTIKDCRQYNTKCPNVIAVNYKHSLEDWPNFEIENYLEDDGYRAYQNFTSLIKNVSTLGTKQEIWDRIAFSIYVQHFIPQQNTPSLNEDDSKYFEAFLETVDELQPEVIILWGVKILNHFKQDFTKQFVEDIKICKNDGHYLKMDYNGKSYNIISAYHPSSRHWYDDLQSLEEILKSILT